MTAAYRAAGAFNGVLPAPTGQVIGFMRDPMKLPYLNYVQEVPAPNDGNGLFRWFEIDPDTAATMVNLDEHAWGFDDPMPSGKGFQVRGRWLEGQTVRYAFPYFLGERTQSGWKSGAKLDLKKLYDRIRLGHAMLHRAVRVVTAIRGYAWTASLNTTDLNTLCGTNANKAYWNQSSGTEKTPAGLRDPAFQIIKNTTNVVQRRLDLTTNGATQGNEYLAVFGPVVAQAIAESGEIVNYLKQQANARADLMVRNKKWGIPDEYNGFKLVVEDTPRATIRTNADGTVADVLAGEKDYIWNDDSVFFGSRVGELDGGYGEQNFSTVQLFTYNGPAAGAIKGAGGKEEDARAGVYVKGESDSWNEVMKGAVVTEDVPKVVAPASGFYLTDVLS